MLTGTGVGPASTKEPLWCKTVGMLRKNDKEPPQNSDPFVHFLRGLQGPGKIGFYVKYYLMETDNIFLEES